ncbi:MAG: hypothetical protein IJX20_04790 [Alphaproteobacteria bacterium]|nr:hypothetical protein [Alphaproteobacteria bacterium]
MTKRKKYVIRWLVFILLAYFVTRPMYYPGVGNNPDVRKEEMLRLQQGNVLSPEETDRFLISWSELLEKGFDNQKLIELLNSTKNPRHAISSRIRRWIEFQGWNLNRFFFIGRRLKKITAECHKLQKANSKRASLEQQLNNTKDESIIGTIKRIIADDSRLSDNVTQAEVDLIMPKLEVIESILKGELVYKPEHG